MAVERKGGVGHFLHTLVTNLGKPEFDGLGFGAGDGLHRAEQGFGSGYVGESLFAICGGHFQLVTTCHQLTSLFIQATFELVPVLASGQVIWLLREYLHRVHHREPPGLGGFVKHASDGLAIKVVGKIFMVTSWEAATPRHSHTALRHTPLHAAGRLARHPLPNAARTVAVAGVAWLKA